MCLRRPARAAAQGMHAQDGEGAARDRVTARRDRWSGGWLAHMRRNAGGSALLGCGGGGVYGLHAPVVATFFGETGGL